MIGLPVCFCYLALSEGEGMPYPYGADKYIVTGGCPYGINQPVIYSGVRKWRGRQRRATEYW